MMAGDVFPISWIVPMPRPSFCTPRKLMSSGWKRSARHIREGDQYLAFKAFRVRQDLVCRCHQYSGGHQANLRLWRAPKKMPSACAFCTSIIFRGAFPLFWMV